VRLVKETLYTAVQNVHVVERFDKFPLEDYRFLQAHS
jgi:hypothetical protein